MDHIKPKGISRREFIKKVGQGSVAWELELVYKGKHPEIKPTAKMAFPLPK